MPKSIARSKPKPKHHEMRTLVKMPQLEVKPATIKVRKDTPATVSA